MFCINCGANLPDGSRFCSNCGAVQNSINTQAQPVQQPVQQQTRPRSYQQQVQQQLDQRMQQQGYRQPVQQQVYQQPLQQPVQQNVQALQQPVKKKKGSLFKKILLIIAAIVVFEVVYSLLTDDPEPPYVQPSVIVDPPSTGGNQGSFGSAVTTSTSSTTAVSTGTSTGVSPSLTEDPKDIFGHNPNGVDWFAKESLTIASAGQNFFLAKFYKGSEDMGDAPMDVFVSVGEELIEGSSGYKKVTASFDLSFYEAPEGSAPALWISAFDRYSGTSFECPGVKDMDITVDFNWGEIKDMSRTVTVTVTCPTSYQGTIFQFSYNDARLREESKQVDLDSRLFKINELPFYHNNGCESLYFSVDGR